MGRKEVVQGLRDALVPQSEEFALVGILKSVSEDSETIEFSPSGSDDYSSIPTEVIKEVETISQTRSASDVVAVVRLTFAEPAKNPEAVAFLRLLQVTTRATTASPASQAQGPTFGGVTRETVLWTDVVCGPCRVVRHWNGLVSDERQCTKLKFSQPYEWEPPRDFGLGVVTEGTWRPGIPRLEVVDSWTESCLGRLPVRGQHSQ